MASPEHPAHHLQDERLWDLDFETELLMDPIKNAGELYDLYDARVQQMATKVQEGQGTVDADVLIEQITRQKMASMFLPEDDPHSYYARKNVNNAGHTRQQG